MAGRIPQHFIDDLIARADIVEVISSRMPLKKAGREFKGLCPFHGEKTPSFTVSPGKQFFHCFGCGAHGTALGFLMEYEHMEFVDAIEALAGSLGIEVPREEGGKDERSNADLYMLLERAADFYWEQMKTSERAKEYLQQRGLDGRTARDFKIGYAPQGWDTLLNLLGKSSVERDGLLESGMIIRKDDGREYDRFRDRIMFPIRDSRGRVIAFGGRVLDQGEPKYLNSPETPVFHKGQELYGLYEARQALRDIPRLLVVEGYMDVASLAQQGIRYAVATLGTATTPDHLRRLFRVCNEVVFCFDGDKAGMRAAWRALENSLSVLREGRQIRFMFLPEGEDPDTLVQSIGAGAFEERLGEAMPLSRFLIQELESQVDSMDSVDGRAHLAELARPLLNRIPMGIYRELLLDELANHVGMAPERLSGLIFDQSRPQAKSAAPTNQAASLGRSNLVRRALELALHYPGAAAALEVQPQLQLVEKKGISLLSSLLEDCRNNPNISTAGLLERWREEPEAPHLGKLASGELLIDLEAAKMELKDSLNKLVRESGPDQRTDWLLKKASDTGLDPAEKQELRELLALRSTRNQADD
ncbi:MAG: DNA primase [Chromatiales bacterium]|nr:DNA primase [Chromatiales bacterium]